MNQTSTFKDKAAANAYAAKDAAKEAISTYQNVENTVRDTAERLGRETRDVVDNVTTQVRDYSGQVRTKIEDQPLQSTVAALAIGFVVGFLFRR